EKELDEARRGLEASLGETKQAQGETQKALGLANTFAYFHRVALADVAIRDGNVEGARKLLEECPKEQRGWKGGDLRQECEAPLMTLGPGPKAELYQAAVSPDGRYVAASDAQTATVWVWDAESGKLAWSARVHKQNQQGVPVPSDVPVAVSADSQILAAG